MPDGAREYPLLCPRASVLIRIYQTRSKGQTIPRRRCHPGASNPTGTAGIP
uniref:Uncharacterized protein n=1 Tax=Anguilla anguilla TaxID=7936 RepID=A0A0E9TRH8_ANGAN